VAVVVAAPILEGLWLDIRVLVVAEIGILVLGLVVASLRTLPGRCSSRYARSPPATSTCSAACRC
jgi:hypothetical protein